MPRKLEFEEGVESLGGEKERYLASIAISERRQAHAMERIAAAAEAGLALVQAFHDSLATLTGDGGPQKVATYGVAVSEAAEPLIAKMRSLESAQ